VLEQLLLRQLGIISGPLVTFVEVESVLGKVLSVFEDEVFVYFGRLLLHLALLRSLFLLDLSFLLSLLFSLLVSLQVGLNKGLQEIKAVLLLGLRLGSAEHTGVGPTHWLLPT
jgi:hypothetical protein